MPITPDQMMNAIIANLPAKTGKSLEEWRALIEAQKFSHDADIVTWLKKEHHLGTVTARIMVEKILRPGPSIYNDGDRLVDEQYSGEFALLRPLYESLVASVKALGTDVIISPRKTYVSLIRNRQFAVIQVVKQKVLLGLVLPGAQTNDT
jgi:hypothetical protein